MKCVIPEAALNQHVAILGKTGSGKSYTARGIVESLLTHGRQVCVLDPTGAWWGLRLGADGKAKGFDRVVLLGGKHADIPLAPRSGAAVARLVTEQGASVVCDTSGMTVGEYTAWFTDFAGALYTTIREPLHLVIDEAHYFMPQGKAPDPAAGKMIHAGNRLMSGGRSLGIRGMMLTQRPAKLHKDSLTCADTLIAMRVIAPQDRKAIQEWVDGAGDQQHGRVVIDSLAGLARGEGWVWYPEGGFLERIKFPKITTYDSSATPTHGAKAVPKVSEIKLDAVKAALADAVREAEANDPKLLRAKIAELERAAKGTPTAESSQERQAALARAAEKAATDRDRHWKDKIGSAQRATERLVAVLTEIARRADAAAKVPTMLPSMDIRVERAMLRVEPDRTRVAQAIVGAESEGQARLLPIGERATLTAAAQYEQGVTREQLTVLTGYKRSTRDAYIYRLREAGLLDVSGDTIKATEAGIAALGNWEPLPTGDALLQWWMAKLPDGEKRVLAMLVEHYPKELERQVIDDATGFKRSTTDAYLYRLEAKRLVERSRGCSKAAEILFG